MVHFTLAVLLNIISKRRQHIKLVLFLKGGGIFGVLVNVMALKKQC